MNQVRNADVRKRRADFAIDEWRRETQRVVKNSVSLDDQRWFLERLLVICEESHIATAKNPNPNVNLAELRYANYIYLSVMYRAEKVWIKFIDSLTDVPEGKLHAFNFRLAMMELMGCSEHSDVLVEVEHAVNEHLPKGVAPWCYSELGEIKMAPDGTSAYVIDLESTVTREEAQALLARVMKR